MRLKQESKSNSFQGRKPDWELADATEQTNGWPKNSAKQDRNNVLTTTNAAGCRPGVISVFS
jgi:hypothetical protein